ncbi:outer membrane receptor protein involved in Fe transport [Caulobacter rhizosphaerae]|uniref:Outer membrane receptor protein involved in Fe transport n=1 Tax=Caulobacter rhizosphaerae TaxID=2010972 RepID=A0ABU1MVM2_9CAUL|nr:TonB-dependent receptor [Caulobacter rhizosphaerae]MDR6530196.1 outer membrane receptor protein involved in Fe transport [Caulobacter rhizosphaerae]
MTVSTKTAVYALGAILSMGAGPSLAQTTPAPAADQAAMVEEVVVTGSRIARRDYTSDTPIVTVGQQAVAASGAVTPEVALNQLPQVTPSAGASASFVARGGQASINLRGIGQQRTLVLVDGRRMQPSGADGSVDLNVIPNALIDNIEVITGGASATYGSDAIAGVVNLKLKRHFNGAQIDAQYGGNEHGDGATKSLTATLGSDFAEDRGNAFVSLGYSKRNPIRFTDRDWLRGQILSNGLESSIVNVVASNLPSQAAVNAVFAKYGVAPGTVSRSSQLSTNQDNTLFTQAGAVNYRGTTSGRYILFGGNVFSVAGDEFVAQTPMTRYNFVGHADYNVSDKVTAFVDGLFTTYKVTTNGPPATAGSSSGKPVTVPVTNPFIPSDLASILASRPNPTAPFTITQAGYAFGNRAEQDDYDVYQFTGGLRGKLDTADMTWEVYGTLGRSRYLATERNYQSIDAMNRLLAAPDGGASLCQGGFNPFGVQPLSKSCRDYIVRTAENLTVLKQQIVEANLQGHAFNLPAGEARFAVGADYRKNSYDFRPDALIQTGELANYLPIFASSGSDEVREVYGELLVPVLAGLPLVKQLDVDLGYRYSDYRTVGGVSTYKADFNWKVVGALGLRGGYARAIRAPSVGELYAASSQGQLTLGNPGLIGSGDPCDVRGAYRAAGSPIAAQVRALCIAQGVPTNLVDTFQNSNPRTPFVTSGNTALEPESTDTYSVGAVLRSTSSNPLLSRLSASVDYYSIKLSDAIGQVTNTVAASQCFNAAVNPTFANSNFYCGLLSRQSATGQLALIQNPQLNLGGYKTSGVDVAFDWSAPFEAFGLSEKLGTLSLNATVNYLIDFKIQTLPGGPTLDYAGSIGNTQIDVFATAHPIWKGAASAAWEVGPVRTALQWRYLGGMDNAANVGTGGTAHGVPSVSYFDLDAVWKVRSGLELRGGVANLADKAPPVLNDSIIGALQTEPYTYDIVGRRFYLAVKASF